MIRKRKGYKGNSFDLEKGGVRKLIFIRIKGCCGECAVAFALQKENRTQKSGRCAENALKPPEKRWDFGSSVGMSAPIRGD